MSGFSGPINRTGPQGIPGLDGLDGSLWHSGDGPPREDLGQDTDFYLDVLTSDIYEKILDRWHFRLNIKGPRGPKGDKGPKGDFIVGPPGSQGPQGPQGPPGPSSSGTMHTGSILVGQTIDITTRALSGFYAWEMNSYFYFLGQSKSKFTKSIASLENNAISETVTNKLGSVKVSTESKIVGSNLVFQAQNNDNQTIYYRVSEILF